MATVSSLIERLKAIQEKEGDVPVVLKTDNNYLYRVSEVGVKRSKEIRDAYWETKSKEDFTKVVYIRGYW